MSQTPAFRQLQAFIKEETARKPRSSKPKPETANDLTKRIVTFVQDHGHFATRLNSTGIYREDIKKFVPSQQRKGLPDTLLIVNGNVAFCEIKAGKDTLSETQIKTIAALEKAGAWVYVAHSFEGFKGWFIKQFLTPPF